jgi:hypothetical protein
MDVWFWGLQLTLQQRPDQLLPGARQGCLRHFRGHTRSFEEFSTSGGSAEAFDVCLDESGSLRSIWEPPPPASSETKGAKSGDPGSNVIKVPESHLSPGGTRPLNHPEACRHFGLSRNPPGLTMAFLPPGVPSHRARGEGSPVRCVA